LESGKWGKGSWGRRARGLAGGGGGYGRLVAGKKKRGGERKGTGGDSERLARSDPARGQFRAQVVARFDEMGERRFKRGKDRRERRRHRNALCASG